MNLNYSTEGHFTLFIGSKVARDKINQIAHKKARGSLGINLVSEAANLLYILGINEHYRGAPRAVQSSARVRSPIAVSYTHLTLPTSDLV